MCHCNLTVIVQSMTVHKTFNDAEEYSLRSIAILGCNIYSQITVAHVTLQKAVLSTVQLFAVHCESLLQCFVVAKLHWVWDRGVT